MTGKFIWEEQNQVERIEKLSKEPGKKIQPRESGSGSLLKERARKNGS